MAASDLAIVYLIHPIKLKFSSVEADYTIIKCRPFVDNNSPLAGSGFTLLNLGSNAENIQICVPFDNVSAVAYESAVAAFTAASYLPTGIQGYVDIS